MRLRNPRRARLPQRIKADVICGKKKDDENHTGTIDGTSRRNVHVFVFGHAPDS